MVDDQPVYEADLVPHLRPAKPRVGAGPPDDPLMRSLDQALRVKLFAREARQRGIPAQEGPPAVAEAYLVQALIQQELDRRDIRVERVSEEEARQHYEQHPKRYNQTTAVELAAIVVADEQLAEQLLYRAEGSDRAEFERLVLVHSLDAPSRKQGGLLGTVSEHGEGIDEAIARVGLAMWHDGQVGLAHAADGRYYVLRATRVDMTRRPWDERLSWTVRNVLAQDRREQALEELAAQLRRNANITVDEMAVHRIAVPK